MPKKEKQKNAYDDAVLKWTAPEHPDHQRGLIWKIIMTMIVLGGAYFAFIYDSWTFALVIIVFAVVYGIINLKPVKNVSIKISNIGVKVGRREYPFQKIKGFWVIYEPPFTTALYIKVPGELMPEIEIAIHNQNPSEIRSMLIKKVPEIAGKRESVSGLLFRLFRI
jgi:hypothetical protein